MTFQRSGERLSVILHPAVLMVITMFLLSWDTRGSVGWAILDVAILVVGILPGLLYIFIKARRGDFGHYQLLIKEERRTVFPILIGGLALSFVLYLATQAPAPLMRGMGLAVVGGIGTAIINRFWKISMHAAVGGGCAALFVFLSLPVVWILIALTLVAGVARLMAQHHTPAQVVGGGLYGFGITVLLNGLLLRFS